VSEELVNRSRRLGIDEPNRLSAITEETRAAFGREPVRVLADIVRGTAPLPSQV